MNKLIFAQGAVGERIRRRRKELNLTQAELAEQVGCATKSCADIERGSCGMSIDMLLSICSVLKLSPATLLLGEALPTFVDADTTSQILAGLAECTEEQRQNILQTIRLFTQYR